MMATSSQQQKPKVAVQKLAPDILGFSIFEFGFRGFLFQNEKHKKWESVSQEQHRWEFSK